MVTELPAGLPTHATFPPPSDVDVPATATAFVAALQKAAAANNGKAYADLFTAEGYWRDVLAFTRDFRTFEANRIAQAASVSWRSQHPPHSGTRS